MRLNENEHNDEKMYTRFNNILTHKIDFTAYGLHRDLPPAWLLNHYIYFIFIIYRSFNVHTVQWELNITNMSTSRAFVDVAAWVISECCV